MMVMAKQKPQQMVMNLRTIQLLTLLKIIFFTNETAMYELMPTEAYLVKPAFRMLYLCSQSCSS